MEKKVTPFRFFIIVISSFLCVESKAIKVLSYDKKNINMIADLRIENDDVQNEHSKSVEDKWD